MNNHDLLVKKFELALERFNGAYADPYADAEDRGDAKRALKDARDALLAALGPTDAIQLTAYAEGRKDQAEADRDSNASSLIDAWCAAHGKSILWEKAVEITAIVTKMPDAEKQRLLAMGEGA